MLEMFSNDPKIVEVLMKSQLYRLMSLVFGQGLGMKKEIKLR